MSNSVGKRTTLSLDAMGGDTAPDHQIKGAVDYLAQQNNESDSVILVGPERLIEDKLTGLGIPDSVRSRISIANASQVIEMNESPVQGFKSKKDASISVCVRLVKEAKSDAVVSAGNTGAVVVASTLIIKPLPCVERPAIAVTFPKRNGFSVLLDAGANSECRPKHLYDFAFMGSEYAGILMGMERPRVGLLSVGEEESKGTDLTRETYKMLSSAKGLNFVGNVEGRDIFADTVDVVVCDGFVGNAVLKASESLIVSLARIVKDEIKKSFLARLAVGGLLGPSIKRLRARLDHAEYGGAPLLGINGVCIKCHGSSNAVSIKNGLNVAKKMVAYGLNERIVKSLSKT